VLLIILYKNVCTFHFDKGYNVRMSNQFGTWLKDKREAAQLSQDALANRAGITKQYVSNLERGQRHSKTGARQKPAIDVVVKLCYELSVSTEEFVSHWLLDESEGSTLRQLARITDDYSIPTKIRAFSQTATQQQIAFIESAIDLASSIKPNLRLIIHEPIHAPEPRRELQAAASGETERGSQEQRTQTANESALQTLQQHLDSKLLKRPQSE
jgi:transcriptional regulator with XRE-family HTH domain